MRKGSAFAVAAALALCTPVAALADDALGDVDTPAVSAKPVAASSDADGQTAGDVDTSAVQVSKEGDAAALEGSSFAMSDFSRAQKGSNRSIDGEYRGYAYLIGQRVGQAAQLVAVNDQVVAYIPPAMAEQLSLDLEDAQTQTQLEQLFCALDVEPKSRRLRCPWSGISTWYFTTQQTYDLGAVRLMFDQEISGKAYVLAIGVDGSDITDSENANYAKPSFADFGVIAPADQVSIVAKPTGLAAAGEFLQNLDWSPLWVSLRTTGIAIVFIVILGLLAAYFCLNLSSRAKSIFDAIFTIPMVLPPTVCGFILLFACGSNTAFGRFWIETGFPLIFSPAACVIAAVVVAFPLMYRNALGAFESLDRNMLDAARTLGWSNAKIFMRLMLPLSWSSIAAGMVLAFARALGEFGATLFMAGNYVGVTRTIPIAIYFEWMNGNSDVAWFWTGVIIVFSLVVIVFINLWSGHTTKYRKRSE